MFSVDGKCWQCAAAHLAYKLDRVVSTSRVHEMRKSVPSQNRSWQESKTVFVLNQFPVALVRLGREHQILRQRWRRRTHSTSFVTWPLRNRKEFGKNAIKFDSNGSKFGAQGIRRRTTGTWFDLIWCEFRHFRAIPSENPSPVGSRFQFVPRPIWFRNLLPSFAVITETGTSINSHHAGNRNSNETNFRSSLLSLWLVVHPKMKWQRHENKLKVSHYQLIKTSDGLIEWIRRESVR